MASPRENNQKTVLAILIVLSVLVLLVAIVGLNVARDTNSQTEQTVKTNVEAAATQCFSVEGAYPPDLSYLIKNYGLQYSSSKFIVSYDRFASDRPPVVEVLAREK